MRRANLGPRACGTWQWPADPTKARHGPRKSDDRVLAKGGLQYLVQEDFRMQSCGMDAIALQGRRQAELALTEVGWSSPKDCAASASKPSQFVGLAFAPAVHSCRC